jgi:hypothetical protein
MSTDTIERLPNTVTKCHAEIRKLREACSNPDIAAIIAERDELKDKLEAAEKKVGELEASVEEGGEIDDPAADQAINAFLDECERIGPMRYDVPQSDRAFRAIVWLHDLVGRNP